MNDLDFVRHCAEAILLCEKDNKTEAEAIRDVWLLRRGFPTKEPAQGQLFMLKEMSCANTDAST